MKRVHTPTNPYVLSYSDLMAALLLVFILLLTATLLNFQDKAERITVLKYEIIEELNALFSQEGVEIAIDEGSGAIYLPSELLFEHSSANLSPEGKDFIDQFVPLYLSVLLDPRFKEDVTQILIEGHTDPSPPKRAGGLDHQGAYLYNLELSLRRANAVAEHVFSLNLETAGDERDLHNLRGAEDHLKGLLTATGMSFSHPVDTLGAPVRHVPYKAVAEGDYSDLGQVDYEKSRRVEFKFRLNDEQYLREIHALLTGELRTGT